jgi:hypothetical protein
MRSFCGLLFDRSSCWREVLLGLSQVFEVAHIRRKVAEFVRIRRLPWWQAPRNMSEFSRIRLRATSKFQVACLLLVLGMCSGLMALEHNMRQLADDVAAYRTLLAGADGAARIAARLRGLEDQEAVSGQLAACAEAVAAAGAHDVAGAVVDRLVQDGDLAGALLAGDVLLHCIHKTNRSNYGATRELQDYPAALCDRAVRLMAHPNPVVQALAEWSLAMRVKMQNSTATPLSQFLRPQPGDADHGWWSAWRERGAAHDLDDDYARQLIQLNRHRTMAGLAQAVQVVEQRWQTLVEDSGTAADETAADAYEQALAAARDAVTGTDLEAAHRAYLRLRRAGRQRLIAGRREWPVEGLAFHTSWSIPNGQWNVNVAAVPHQNSPGGEIFIKRGTDPEDPVEGLLGDRLGGGAIRGFDLDWEADNLLFAFWSLPLDPDARQGFTNNNARIYRMRVDGSELTRLTDSPGDNDVEPCWLPDGGVMFVSDRSSFGNQCAGPFIQTKRCTTLFRLPASGGEPIMISNNKDFDRHPRMLNDGSIVFMHWEYQERSLYNTHALWSCRPDGTNMDAFYKQHISEPLSMRETRQVPDSDWCVSTAQGHHEGHQGPVVLFNPSLGINNTASLLNVTPGVSVSDGNRLGSLHQQVVPEGGVRTRGGTFINPFPLSEQAFLVGHDLTNHVNEFSLYYIDVWGNRELLHRDPDMSCFSPHPLRPRQRPPVVADSANPEAPNALAFLENVYNDLPGVEPGAVKFLRMSLSLPLPTPVDYDDPRYPANHLKFLPGDSTASHFGHWSWTPSVTIGMIEVAEDGSAFFQVPAGVPVYLQALDENYAEIRRMRTSFTLQRGEFRGCVGCHETRLEAVASRERYPQATLAKGPQRPVPPSWGETHVLDFRQDIQPIFDRHCVSCHGQQNPADGIELTRRERSGFYQSYRSLFGLAWDDPTPVREMSIHRILYPDAVDDPSIEGRDAGRIHKQMADNQQPGQLVAIPNRVDAKAEITQPYQFGSNRSRLITVLLEDAGEHRGLRRTIGEQDWLKLVTWVDYNANYHSTLMDSSRVRGTPEEVTGTITRIPYLLPSAWEVAESQRLFHNTMDDIRERHQRSH